MQNIVFASGGSEYFLQNFFAGTPVVTATDYWVTPLDNLQLEFSGLTRQVLSLADAVGDQRATDSDLVWTSVPATITVDSLGFFDAATAGNLVFWAPVENGSSTPTPIVVETGEDLRLPSGSLIFTI